MVPSKPIESLHAESDRASKFRPPASDGEAIVDLARDNTVDVAPTAADVRSAAMDSNAADSGESDDLPPDLLPKQRAWGFLAFVVCALTVMSVAMQRHVGSLNLGAAATSAPMPLPLADAEGSSSPLESQPIHAGAAAASSSSHATANPLVEDASGARAAASNADIAKANTTLGVVAFDPGSVVTSERAVAAVFIVKRTDPARGRASVQWSVHSGSADAGIDFSDAYGTIRFADGQRQLAIYVPLRNDLLKEDSETFKVCLRSPRQARIGAMSCAEATIRDDDAEQP